MNETWYLKSRKLETEIKSMKGKFVQQTSKMNEDSIPFWEKNISNIYSLKIY